MRCLYLVEKVNGVMILAQKKKKNGVVSYYESFLTLLLKDSYFFLFSFSFINSTVYNERWRI